MFKSSIQVIVGSINLKKKKELTTLHKKSVTKRHKRSLKEALIFAFNFIHFELES